jgi:hypothetical protein
LFAILVSIGWGCGSNPIRPSLTSDPRSAPTGPAAIPFRGFGVVTNDDGAPLAGANVTLTYQPDLAAIQSASGVTAADGRYELQLNARQPGNVSAVVRAVSSAEYNPSEQYVRVADGVERNLRLRRVRTITAGQSAAIKFDDDSSVCSSLGIGGLCEWLRIQSPSTFTARLAVTATGAAVPTLRASVPPLFPGISSAHTTVVGQGSVTLQTGDEEYWELYTPRTVDVAISIPAGTAPQQYVITVSTPDAQ